MLVVLKKDGTARVVFDYRLLNNVTVDQQYTMKDAEEVLQTAAGHRYLSTLDFLSGYHQIPMADNCKEMTAFSAPQAPKEANTISKSCPLASRMPQPHSSNLSTMSSENI